MRLQRKKAPAAQPVFRSVGLPQQMRVCVWLCLMWRSAPTPFVCSPCLHPLSVPVCLHGGFRAFVAGRSDATSALDPGPGSVLGCFTSTVELFYHYVGTSRHLRGILHSILDVVPCMVWKHLAAPALPPLQYTPSLSGAAMYS